VEELLGAVIAGGGPDRGDEFRGRHQPGFVPMQQRGLINHLLQFGGGERAVRSEDIGGPLIVKLEQDLAQIEHDGFWGIHGGRQLCGRKSGRF
jgi:hypothetical protein